MKDIGVAEADIYANRFNTIKPKTDSIGVTIGMKKLSDGGILIPIAIRGSNYACIHSVINRADVVPRVAPVSMGFKRYGVDHYIPGSNAGTVQTADDGNKYDNTSYNTASTEYQAVKTKMLAQLSAVIEGVDVAYIRKQCTAKKYVPRAFLVSMANKECQQMGRTQRVHILLLA